MANASSVPTAITKLLENVFKQTDRRLTWSLHLRPTQTSLIMPTSTEQHKISLCSSTRGARISEVQLLNHQIKPAFQFNHQLSHWLPRLQLLVKWCTFIKSKKSHKAHTSWMSGSSTPIWTPMSSKHWMPWRRCQVPNAAGLTINLERVLANTSLDSLESLSMLTTKGMVPHQNMLSSSQKVKSKVEKPMALLE